MRFEVKGKSGELLGYVTAQNDSEALAKGMQEHPECASVVECQEIDHEPHGR